MSRVLGEAWAHLSHVPLRAEASDRSECVNEVLAGETVTNSRWDVETGLIRFMTIMGLDGSTPTQSGNRTLKHSHSTCCSQRLA